jgi:hypothetical protein
LDQGPLDAALPMFSHNDESSSVVGNRPGSSDDEEDDDEEDGDGLDVDLLDEGREATNCDVMEQSAAPDFPDAGSTLHSRRSSIQVAGGSAGLLPPMVAMHPAVMLPTALDFDRLGSRSTLSVLSSSTAGSNSGSMGVSGFPPPPPVASGTSRFGGRRASMPSNRLEM